MKKACYSSLIFSYLLLCFILIYSNLINPEYDSALILILSTIVIAIWIVVPIFLILGKKHCMTTKDNKLEDWLSALAFAPIIIVSIIPVLLFLSIYSIIDLIKNRMKNKCKALLVKEFVFTKEKKNKKTFYILSKDDVIIKICEFDIYEISNDRGITYAPITESALFSYDDRIEIENIINNYKSCDYRDKDIYEPTTKIIEIISKYFS